MSTPNPTEIDAETPRKIRPTKAEKAAKKAEKKRLKALAKLEAERQLLRNQLAREETFTAVTRQRAESDWLEMLKDIKLPEFQNEVETLVGELSNLIDRKYFIIDRLKDDQAEAELQYRRNAGKHINIIDYFLKTHTLFINSLQRFYEIDSKNLLYNFYRDTYDRENILLARKTYYENLLHATNLLASTARDNQKRSFLQTKEEIISVESERQEKMRADTLKTMYAIYGQMQNIVQEMKDSTESEGRKKVYEFLVERDRKDVIDLKQIEADIVVAERTLEQLQVNFLCEETKTKQKLLDYKNEKNYFLQCYNLLKETFLSDIVSDRTSLRHLAYQASEAIHRLDDQTKMVEKVLEIGSACRRLQTEQEKVVPWGLDFEDTQRSDLNRIDNPKLIRKELDHLPELNLFFEKVSLSEYNCLELTDEKRKLSKENENYRITIRKYCETMKLREAIASLKLSPYPTVRIPVQEASLTHQIISECKRKQQRLLKLKGKRNFK